IEPLHGEVEAAAFGVLQKEEVPLAPLHRHGLESVVAADAMRLVHHEVVGLEIREGGDGLAALEDGTTEAAAPRPEDALLRAHDRAGAGQLEPRRAVACDDAEPFAAPQGGARPRLELVLAEDAL